MHAFNYRMISALNGTQLIIVAGMMFLSTVWCFIYDEEWQSLILSALITLTAGLVLRLPNSKKGKTEVHKRDGFLIVSSGWLLMSLFGSLPYLISGEISGFIDAWFETMSGFTTTGATILNDIEAMPKSLLFWRSMTHWIGGMGIIVLAVAILPLLGVGGMQLFVAEAPGVTPDKLHPRITGTAKRLWLIYFSLTIAEAVLLKFAGMSFFDAINHAMATMATGGFSTKNASIAAFSSPAIHYIIIVFMFLAGVNFTLLYLGFTGRVKRIFKNEELKVYFFNTLIFGAVVSVLLILFSAYPFEKAFRNGFFMVISIMTTTGFVTVDYLVWPPFITFIIFVLFFSGGSTGSTAGGIKIMRHIVLIKNSFLELKRQLHPNAIIPVRLNKEAVPQGITNTIAGFILIWLMVFFIGSLVMSSLGLDFETAIGTVTATLGNIGPGLGSVGPVENFANIPPAGKVFLSVLMLIGRLELFTVLILFMPHYWRKA